MSQDTTPFATIDPGTTSGINLATLLNNWRDAVRSSHSGTSRPAYAVAGMIWLKNSVPTAWELNLYDGADDIVLMTIDTVANSVNFGTLSSPILIQEGAGNATVAPLSGSSLSVKGDDDTGIMIASPDNKTSSLYLGSPSTPAAAEMRWGYTTKSLILGTNEATGTLSLRTGAQVVAMFIKADQKVGFGTSTPVTQAHFWTGSSSMVDPSTFGDVTIEGNPIAGLNLAAPAGGAGYVNFPNSTLASAGSLSYNHANDWLQLKASVAGGAIDLRANAKKNLFLDGDKGYAGINTIVPEGYLHIGVAMTTTFASALADSQSFIMCKQLGESPFGRMYLQGTNGVGINFVAANAATNERLFSVENNYGLMQIKKWTDDLITETIFMEFKASDGEIYLPQLAPGSGTLNLRIDSTGKVYTA